MKSLEKFFDVIGEILAVLLVVVWALLIVNANFGFLPEGVLSAFLYIKEYGTILLIGVVGVEAMIKRNIIFQIIFYALMAVIIIFLFFPDTYVNLIGSIA